MPRRNDEVIYECDRCGAAFSEDGYRYVREVEVETEYGTGWDTVCLDCLSEEEQSLI